MTQSDLQRSLIGQAGLTWTSSQKLQQLMPYSNACRPVQFHMLCHSSETQAQAPIQCATVLSWLWWTGETWLENVQHGISAYWRQIGNIQMTQLCSWPLSNISCFWDWAPVADTQLPAACQAIHHTVRYHQAWKTLTKHQNPFDVEPCKMRAVKSCCLHKAKFGNLMHLAVKARLNLSRFQIELDTFESLLTRHSYAETAYKSPRRKLDTIKDCNQNCWSQMCTRYQTWQSFSQGPRQFCIFTSWVLSASLTLAGHFRGWR